MSSKKNPILSFLNRCFDSWWFNLILGFVALVIISLLMFDAVLIAVLGRSMILDIPK